MKAVYLHNDVLIAYEVDYKSQEIEYASMPVDGMDAEEFNEAVAVCTMSLGMDL